MQRNFWVFFIITFLVFAGAKQVFAQDATPSADDVNRIARQLYCPVCENTPLDVCPTQACAQWRDLIREKLAAGWSDEQVKQYFAAQYGERVLAEPPNPLIYIVLPILSLIGIYILYRALASMRKPAVAKIESNAPHSDDYLRKVEEELKKRD